MQIIIDTNKPVDQETLVVLSEAFDKSDISGVAFTKEDRKGISKEALDQYLTSQAAMYINFHQTKRTVGAR